MPHLLLALPLVALLLFFVMPWQTALIIYIPILLIFGFLYWKALSAMHMKPLAGEESMLNQRAVVDFIEDGRLKVRCRGEIFDADGPAGLAVGQQVVVTGTRGLRLQVRPLGKSALGKPATPPGP
ncbi:MAG: NfeD family protein [Acidobacteriota bacterium]|jgi:inner membrane protein